MTAMQWLRVEVSDTLPNGKERRFSQMWDRNLCNVSGDTVTNTHTGRTARLLDRIDGSESGAPVRRAE